MTLLPSLASRAATWSSKVDLPIPGSPPTSIAEPGDDPAADRAVELGKPARQPLGQRRRRLEADQRDHAPAAL